jgi:putative transposase
MGYRASTTQCIVRLLPLRSVKQLRNKRHASLTSWIARCKPGSRGHRKLAKSKVRASAKLRRLQRDILHKASRQVVEFCQANDVCEIVVGDVRDIQNGVNLGKNANQKIGQWPHGQFIQYLSYKARRYGIRVEQSSEDYPTRTCSCCTTVKAHAPRGRVYTCAGRGTVIHRDVNGACNFCSRACHGTYGLLLMYLQPVSWSSSKPLWRSRAFETGLRTIVRLLLGDFSNNPRSLGLGSFRVCKDSTHRKPFIPQGG